MAQLEKEQGSLSVYHDKQAKATANIAMLEGQLSDAQKLLAKREQERQDALADKKLLEQDNVIIKKEIGDMEVTVQKLEQDKTARDHTIKTLNEEIAGQDEVINKLTKEKKNRANVERERRKIEGELKVAQETVNEMERTRKELEASYERKDRDLAGMLSKLEDEQALVAKIQKGIKENQARIEQMEEELEAE